MSGTSLFQYTTNIVYYVHHCWTFYYTEVWNNIIGVLKIKESDCSYWCQYNARIDDLQ